MQEVSTPTVRKMYEQDLECAAKVHQEAFPRQRSSYQWLECNLNAAPRMLSYVVLINHRCVGYIIWSQKSGFRPEVILELEQIAVASNYRGQGIGRQLIVASLPDVKTQLSHQGAVLKHIVVTTRSDNHAQRLYKETLGAEVEAVISNLYSADEVFMVARHL